MVTDPLTDILGRAAGWPNVGEPSLDLAEQTRLIALFDPAVRGDALNTVLASLGRSTVVVNEWIVGPEASAKLSGSRGLVLHGRTAGASSSGRAIELQLVEAAKGVHEWSVGRTASEVVALAPRVWERLFGDAPLLVFGHDESTPVPLNTQLLGAQLRHSGLTSDRYQYLNSVLLTVPPPPACASVLDVVVENQSSFQTPLLIVPLDPLPAASLSTFSLGSGVSTFAFRLKQPTCEARPTTFLLHTAYWWDARFSVDEAAWDRALN
ncbi:MAG: hypothetical protein QM736_23670 [Vicinamibacterales bacterium]